MATLRFLCLSINGPLCRQGALRRCCWPACMMGIGHSTRSSLSKPGRLADGTVTVCALYVSHRSLSRSLKGRRSHDRCCLRSWVNRALMVVGRGHRSGGTVELGRHIALSLIPIQANVIAWLWADPFEGRRAKPAHLSKKPCVAVGSLHSALSLLCAA